MTGFTPIATSQVFVGNMEIPYELSGQTHSFRHNGRAIRVTLPTLQLDDESHLTSSSQKYAEISSWVPSLGIDSALFNIIRVFVEADVEEELNAPNGLFDTQANALQFFTRHEQERNSALVVHYAEEMWAAYLYWLQIVRWVSREWLLGRQDANQKSNDPGVSFARIENADNGRPFWIAGGQLALLKRAQITARTWATIQSALTAQATPPTWIVFLNEAAERMHLGDTNGCITSCAIASEAAVRAVYHIASGSPTSPAVIDLMQRASVSAIIEKLEKLTSESKAPPGKSEMLRLAQIRNGLMHSGDAKSLNRSAAANLFKATQGFVMHADAWYHKAASLTNYGLVEN